MTARMITAFTRMETNTSPIHHTHDPYSLAAMIAQWTGLGLYSLADPRVSVYPAFGLPAVSAIR